MNYYTHGGLFHCDEVTGWVICKLAGVCDDFVRVNDFNNIPTDGLIADIGRVHDPEKLLFDHHQGFACREDGFPYASAGLLWDEYGLKIVDQFTDENSSKNRELIWKRVDDKLIKGLDAHDSDNDYSLGGFCSAGSVNVHSLSNIVSFYNEKDIKNDAAQRLAFARAAEVVRVTLEKAVVDAVAFYRDLERFDELATVENNIAVMSEGINWKEAAAEKYPDLKFIILPSNHPANPFSLQAVPVEPSSREVKIPIERPEWFEGFIHQGKWIAGSDSLDELVKLANYNLLIPNE